MTTKVYILILLFMVSAVSFAQVEFTAKAAKEKVALNERLKVTFEMNENGDDFSPPDFKDFRIYAGPAQSISQSWVNGVSKFSKTYTYYLEPTKKGKFTIGQAEVKIKGETYKTSPIEVEVTSAVDEPKDEDNQPIRKATEGIHLVAEISNAKPYVNEGVNVIYKLYVSPDAAISNWGFSDIPKFSNFWSHDIEIKNFDVKYGSYKGNKDYRYVVLKRTVLYPQKSGELKIEPLTLNVSVDVPTNRRDFFGRTVYESEEKTIASNSLNLEVKSLPQENRPESFNGAVGEFSIKTESSKETLEEEESLDIQVIVSGKGNLKLFQPPKLKVPRAFEAYSPESTENIQTTLSGSQGKITDTYTLIPNAKGEYHIEPISFSYFNPKTEKYETTTSNPLEITVEGGSTDSTIASAENDSAEESIRKPVTTAQQFNYIKLKTDLHAIDKSPFFRSKLFWSLLFAPIVILPIVIVLGKNRKEKSKNISRGRARQADRLVRRYLSEAKQKIGDQNAYYEALERALHNYLKAKLNIQTSEITKSRILEILQEKNLNPQTAQDFISLLEACEFARYTPPSDTGMQQDYDKAAKIIAEVDKQLKA